MLEKRLVVLMVAVLAAVAVAQTKPEMGAGTAPAASAPAVVKVPADYSTPVAAAKSLVRASDGKDVAGVREALAVMPAEAGDLDVLLDTMDATWKLQDAARKAYGMLGEKAFASGGMALAEQLKALDDAKSDEKGDKATLTLPAVEGEAARTVVLKKTASGWKTDAGELYGLGTPEGKTRVERAKQVTAIAQDITKSITGGKMMSASEAYQVFWARCQALVTGGAGAASAPASGAATIP